MFPRFLVSRARRPKFELSLRIFDLNNVPLVSGTSYVKWHLPSSTSAEHRGRTDKALIKEHKVCWDYIRTIPVRLMIDKNSNLQECAINFEVVQDYSSGGRGEKIALGFVTLNLAEYVEESDNAGLEGEEGITRRYLMQDSKINSTLRIGILMKQVDGERNFVAPPLKTAAVFGGIAGIMAGDQGEQDDLGGIPSMSKSRDYSELQDIYRRALAASWAAQPGELLADQCIDDIFNGGDGWDSKHHEKKPTANLTRDDTVSGDEMQKERHHHRTNSSSSTKSQSTVTGKLNTPRIRHRLSKSKDSTIRVAETPSPQTDISSASSDMIRSGIIRAKEIDEFKVRDDLCAWTKPRVQYKTAS